MILFYIILGVFIISTILAASALFSNWKLKVEIFTTSAALALAIALVMGLMGIVIANSNTTHKFLNQETYQELMLYKEVVEESYDEVLRYDYYNKVQKWNEGYIRWYEKNNSNFISFFIPDHQYDGCDIIDFELRRG